MTTWLFATLLMALPPQDGLAVPGDEASGGSRAKESDGEVSAGLPPLPELMDQVRQAGGLLIAAHRGGPAPGFPENAIQTLQHGWEAGLRVFEVDVAESQDGVLYLMHDRSLRRTGGYDGGVADTDWSVVVGLDLRDSDGQPTGFHPPTLQDTLRWAKRSGSILELDRKSTTSFKNIVSVVRATEAENHVLLISYSDDEALEIARLAPELMLTTGVTDSEHQAQLVAGGVNLEHVVAWMGTRAPDTEAFARLGESGIESAFGTLGRPGRRLDDVYCEDGDAAEYQALVDGGLTLLATDRPYFVARELASDDVALALFQQGTDQASPVVPIQAADAFGQRFRNLESMATGEWWKAEPHPRRTMSLDVPRDEVLAFALYTHAGGTLKLSAQLFPLYPDEAREVRLELRHGEGDWELVATEPVVALGWSAHFRIEGWDDSKDVAYRVRHGADAAFQGLIRRDPGYKDVIVVGNLSCNSSRTPGPRPAMIDNLQRLDPDLLFFAGDQSYHHTEHTYGWLEFGVQFRDVLRDRPVITIPDDHDVGQANIWGENGKQASNSQGPSGGYFYPAAYVNMVQRCQTWHLPDAFDPRAIERGIGVYFTSLNVGGIDFAILEDRKFKSGPQGKIPKMGPRPDHINDPKYDRAAVDLPELELLGDRQIAFLNDWTQDWTGAEMKCVLSQTAFCGAVHLHGEEDNRLLADLDSNAWPQTGRNEALRAIRRAWAPHLCGDQHLAVVVKHGIDGFGDGPYGFTSPAIVNTIYGRWWWPEEEQAGPNPVEGSPLPWTGDFLDGLGNPISMIAYANPPNRRDEQQRGDGFGVARFDKAAGTVTVECWPRFADTREGDAAQFPGWPVTFQYRDNDGRKPVGYLAAPKILTEHPSAVVQVIEEGSGEILYTVRMRGADSRLPVYGPGTYTVRAGLETPDQLVGTGLEAD